MKQYFIYMVTTQKNTALYIGVTNDLVRRVYEHKHEIIDGFTKKYKTKKLVYFEVYDDPQYAIQREKQLKGWVRKRKNALIETTNPSYRDLYEDIIK